MPKRKPPIKTTNTNALIPGVIIVIIFLIIIGVLIQHRLLSEHAKITAAHRLMNEQTKGSSWPILLSLTPAPTPLAYRKVRLPIIMYHYVEYVKNFRDLLRQSLNIRPNEFAIEMQALSENNYHSLYVRDIPDIIKNKKPLPDKPIVLTFDDGYEDFYNGAFPILKKYKLKSTIFIIYDFIGRPGFMNAKEIQELIDSGIVEVGSHSLTHPDLKHLTKEESIKEIVDSKRNIEKTFNYSVSSFAYPSGQFSSDTVNIVKEASYSAAVSVMPGINQDINNIFYMYRIRPGIFSGGNITSVLEKYPSK